MYTLNNLPKVTSWLSAQKNESMKSNLEYLKEAITNGNRIEALEFLEGATNDMNRLSRKVHNLQQYESKCDELKNQIEERNDWINPSTMKAVDCGVGVVLVKCDSLTLAFKLEDFLSTLRTEHVGNPVLY